MALLRIRKPDGEIVEIASLPGVKGEDGKTPEKGVDYFTPEDIQEILVPATSKTYGTVKVADDSLMASISNGIYLDKTGRASIVPATNDDIDLGFSGTVITPINLEYAVKSVGDGYYATAEDIGDIDAALDSIIAIQKSLIGGGAE